MFTISRKNLIVNNGRGLPYNMYPVNLNQTAYQRELKRGAENSLK